MKTSEKKVLTQLEKAYEAVAKVAAESAMETLANLGVSNTDDIEKEVADVVYNNLTLRGV